MKKWLCIVLTVCLCLSACQATPEEDFVIGKIDESIYQNGGAEMVPVKEAQGYGPWNWKDFTYQDSFEGADGKAEIEVNLSGRYLDGKVPVLRVSHHTVTVEDLKAAAAVLMPADKYYDPTKLIDPEILESWIREGLNAVTYREMLENMENGSSEQETDWQTHPSSENYYSLEYHPDKEETDDTNLFIRTLSDENGNFGFLEFGDFTGPEFCSNELEYYKANGYLSRGFCFGSRDKNKDPKNTLTREEEAEKVIEKLRELGLEMHPSSLSGGESGMMLWFYPSYLGIDYLCAQVQSPYVQEHRPECLYVEVRGDEVFHLKRICASDAVIEKDSLELISQEKALAAFKKYMQTVYTGVNAANSGIPVFPDQMVEDADSVRVEVNRMQFGYVRIPIENEPQEFRLVPAWVFYGQSYIDYEGETHKVFEYYANPGIANDQILMVVNAVDGSYIEAEREMFE